MLVIHIVKVTPGYSILYPNGMQQYGTNLSALIREAEEIADYFTGKGHPCHVDLDDDTWQDAFGGGPGSLNGGAMFEPHDMSGTEWMPDEPTE